MTSSTAPTATPILVPSNAVDGAAGDVAKPPVGASLVPSSQVVESDDDDDVSVDVRGTLDGLTVDQLVALEAAGGDQAKIAAAIGESGAAVVAATVIDEDDDGAAAAPVAPAVVPAGDAAAGAKSSPRLSIKGLTDDDAAMTRAAVSAVKEGRFATIIDAMVGLYSDKMPAGATGAPVAAPAVEAAAPVVSEPAVLEPSAELVALRDQVATIDAQIDEANSTFDTFKANQLLRERQDLIRKLDREEMKFEQEAQQFAAFEAGVDASTERAMAAYPDLGVEGSAAFSAVEDAIILARAKGDDIFNQSDWPEQIAKRTLERLSGTPGAVQNSPTKPAPAAQIPAPLPIGVRMPGSLVGSGAQAEQLNAISAAAELEKMSPDERIRALELADQRLAGR